MKSSNLRNFTAVLARIAEIIAWAGVGISGICLFIVLFFRNVLVGVLTEENVSDYLVIKDFDLRFVDSSNFIPMIIFALITAAITAALVAFMFHNINQIFQSTNTESPFSEKNVNRVKEIGYIALAIPVLKIIANMILYFFVHELSLEVELSEILFGLIVLCLSQYFAYGASLEQDVDGLL